MTAAHVHRRPPTRHRIRRRPRALPAGVHCTMCRAIAGRALRVVPRDLEAIIPPIFIVFFFFIVNIGDAGEPHPEQHPGVRLHRVRDGDRSAARRHRRVAAQAVVVDVQNGYFDRLLLTPVRRSANPIGHMVADVAVSAMLCVPIIGLGFVARHPLLRPGPWVCSMFIVLASLWSLAFAGFGYAIALKTGNPAAVNSSFLLFFPFLFLTSSYVPRDQLSGWLDTVAGWNPVTYLLEGMRHSPSAGMALGRPRASGTGSCWSCSSISFCLCFAALRSRVPARLIVAHAPDRRTVPLKAAATRRVDPSATSIRRRRRGSTRRNEQMSRSA